MAIDKSPTGMACKPERIAISLKRWRVLRRTCRSRYAGMCYTGLPCEFQACPFVARWIRKKYADTNGLRYVRNSAF